MHPDPAQAAQLRVHALIDEVSRLLQSQPGRDGKLRAVVTCDREGGKSRRKRRARNLEANGNFVLTLNLPKNRCELVTVALEGQLGNQVVEMGSEIAVTASLEVVPAGTPKSCQRGVDYRAFGTCP